MDKLEEKELSQISGGDSSFVSGPIISAIVSIIRLIRDAGYDLGSGVRRISENEICPIP